MKKNRGLASSAYVTLLNVLWALILGLSCVREQGEPPFLPLQIEIKRQCPPNHPQISPAFDTMNKHNFFTTKIEIWSSLIRLEGLGIRMGTASYAISQERSFGALNLSVWRV